MNKGKWIIAVATAIALSAGAAIAAELENFSGQSCGAFEGTWHFVNNQVPAGSGVGTLEATFTSGTHVVQASTVNNSTQHFFVIASGDLVSAFTNLGGRLVLSDFSCGGGKEEPPKGEEPPKEEPPKKDY